MIILDTNIISEMMKQSPSYEVLSWIDQQEMTELYITAITIGEITYGINILQEGKQRLFLENIFHKTINESFKHRVLFFDESAAYVYGNLMSHRKKLGRPLSILDGQIAAIALVQGSVLATRNIRDFVNCGLELINPF